MFKKLFINADKSWLSYKTSGDSEALTSEQSKRLYLTNQVAMFTGLLTVGYFFIFLLSELFLPTLISFLAAATYFIVLRLNASHSYAVATVVLLFNGNLQISSIAFLLGRDSGIHFFLFAAILSPFLYYSIQKIKIPLLFSGFSALLYVLLELSFYYLEPPIALQESMNKAIYVTTYLSCMLALVVFAVYLYTENLVSESRLDKERQRSESLLLNIMPQSIATRLKNGETGIADDYDNVSVLFSDLVGFTPVAAKLSAQEAFNLLSEIFNYFDSIIERHGVEKIRTVGDGYYVASGVPQSRPDHAQALAAVALEMMNFRSCSTSPLVQQMELRIGINSGPLIAGVIGSTKYQFDMWGDTVNTASRMELHGLPGEIQISAASYELIKDEFECEPRGTLQIKGKDDMQTWFVKAAKKKV